ncbi:MAG: DEAD/DEAH box helicase family protein, partial [Oscillibacter sp.]|nr:DEAD/DEAH box helicase family protein [Oscillibacter sp.]
MSRTQAVFRRQDKMLWNCKMRFGKTVTAYSLIQAENYQKVIVVTHRPAVEAGWREDFTLVFGKDSDRIFHSKAYARQDDLFDAKIDADNDRTLRNLSDSGHPFVYFASVQDLRHSAPVGGKYDKNNAVFEMDWDLIIYDEAHEGTQTELGQAVQNALEAEKNGKKPKILSLSGTPYNIIGKYEENVYSWDYVMEQKRKREWDQIHPGDHNPYADLPEMWILTFDLGKAMETSYRYETFDAAFNFTEFFRTWTGDPKQDFRPLPSGAKVGDFVHEDDVIRFLDLISADDSESGYPFSTPERREMFRHTFWMVPGVKAARALSVLLREHPVFRAYKIANVAGEGDAEVPYDDALRLVKETIRENPFSITISCGRLTTGVTVPEWTAVMMLAGSSSAAASGYMQTIFRVQSAGVINGKQKERCYVFDFAPDRTLTVLSEAHSLTKRWRKNDEDSQNILGDFLNFCPVLAYDGTRMTEYDVPHMMRQIKRMTVDKAVKSGFDDESVYKADTGIVMNREDTDVFNRLGNILSGQKQSKRPTKVIINNQGLTEEEYDRAGKISRKPKRKLTKEEQELLDKLKEVNQNRKRVIALLRNISIRLPLLIYGADVDLTESIRMTDFVTLVDNESWKEFMPKQVSKELFKRLLKYYDEDVVIGAGLRIRRMAKAADELPPTKRVQQIAEIFQTFRNPDKETVLTPWRVVNMHLSDTIGGYCFLDENFDQDNPLETPRLVEQEDVTANLLLNPDVKILEMNSKSGLYPLYMAYSVYAMRLNGNEEELPLERTQELWRQVLQEHIFVLCRTKMAQCITRRTLAGYQDWTVNAIYLSKLIEERMKDQQRLSRKLRNPATWGKEGKHMEFSAVIGNPPYQITGGSGGTNDAPVYQDFVELAQTV